MKLLKKAYAKINLSIDVLSKRPDSYHELDMILQSVSLYDLVSVEKDESGIITLKTDHPGLPLDAKNDAFKAALLMKEKFGLKSGYRIALKKRIPIEAGLGGGSSDAASVINAICTLENLKVSDRDLFEVGLKIGAELPYSIKSGLARVRGIGENVQRLDASFPFFYTIVMPPLSLSTKDIFQRYQVSSHPDSHSQRLESAILNNDPDTALKHMCNDLERVSLRLHKEPAEIKHELLRVGALHSLMSGSGPSIFGVFRDFDQAKRAELHFLNAGYKAFAVRATNEGKEV